MQTPAGNILRLTMAALVGFWLPLWCCCVGVVVTEAVMPVRGVATTIASADVTEHAAQPVPGMACGQRCGTASEPTQNPQPHGHPEPDDCQCQDLQHLTRSATADVLPYPSNQPTTLMLPALPLPLHIASAADACCPLHRSDDPSPRMPAGESLRALHCMLLI